jgi:hypothetical protein
MRYPSLTKFLIPDTSATGLNEMYYLNEFELYL